MVAVPTSCWDKWGMLHWSWTAEVPHHSYHHIRMARQWHTTHSPCVPRTMGCMEGSSAKDTVHASLLENHHFYFRLLCNIIKRGRKNMFCTVHHWHMKKNRCNTFSSTLDIANSINNKEIQLICIGIQLSHMMDKYVCNILSYLVVNSLAQSRCCNWTCSIPTEVFVCTPPGTGMPPWLAGPDWWP